VCVVTARASLLLNSHNDGKKIERQICVKIFPNLIETHGREISTHQCSLGYQKFFSFFFFSSLFFFLFFPLVSFRFFFVKQHTTERPVRRRRRRTESFVQKATRETRVVLKKGTTAGTFAKVKKRSRRRKASSERNYIYTYTTTSRSRIRKR
jgi:hypothetical protein